ncbi:class I SAM-dependent methyltransferase [Paenibacillus sedimenti]|uniref:Class I SAM-dependent methyltransferase n=1 Tax=Paenibacillus sedimenti TaxID=2770274 RepID=A0A926KSV1_9BACL|nr:class I SAM-dependent methyltransferase [Paenibacillus sedimenti]MBD0382531.1 class I SAM-dependent methyltransferase [Paenibacillus sedimenti]
MSRDEKIYQDRAEMYDRLISKQPSLEKVINGIRSFCKLDVVDLGAGTGRLTSFLAVEAKSVISLDSSKVMLDLLEARLIENKHQNCKTIVADHRDLPLDDASADLVVAGWSLCYLASSNVPKWRHHLKRMMAEIQRVLRKDGTVIIIETLGTGVHEPMRYDFLEPYFDKLENEYGYKHIWIQADYVFGDLDEAKELTRYFFGDVLANKVIENKWSVLPEFAGVWYKHLG